MKNFTFTKWMLIASANAAAFVTAPAAFAQDAMSLDGIVQVEKTVVENGEEKVVLLAPETVVPGDRLIFTTTYRNDGSKLVEDFVVTSPIPDAVAVSDASAALLVVSADDGKTFGPLSSLKVADEAEGERPAIAADVTHIRWILPDVEPGQSGTLIYSAAVR